MGNMVNEDFLIKKIIIEMKKDYLIGEEKDEFTLLISSDFWNTTSACGKMITSSHSWRLLGPFIVLFSSVVVFALELSHIPFSCIELETKYSLNIKKKEITKHQPLDLSWVP